MKLNFRLTTISNKSGLFVVSEERNTHPNYHFFFCHRVLRVGGAMVLLLSEDHLRDFGGSSIPPTSQSNITDPKMRTFLNPDKRSGTSDTASPSQKASSSQCPSRVVPCGSLVPVECFKVSLGKTDAFICKYKKAPASGPPPAGCHEPGAPPEMASLPESPRLQDSL